MKIKKIIFAASFVLTLTASSLSPAFTASASNQTYTVEQCENSVTPRSHKIEWVYKIDNGKLYKRLYNASTDTWLGDWIYVCEYPG